ncbi:MAG TPA: hypothetical protein VF755_13065 [Catenuloplanes sp.]|jgi:hypothetical protein
MATAEPTPSTPMLVTPTLDREALEELADEVTQLFERAVAEGVRRGLELPGCGGRR